MALLVAGHARAAERPTAVAPMATAATVAGAKVDEPTGFERAEFGMSLGEVWKMYPNAELLASTATLGASNVGGPYIDRLALRNHPVPGFDKPTTVELRFWKDKLWGVIIYFGDNDPDKCKALLAKTFGPTTSRDPNHPVWRGDRVTTIGAYKQSWYGSSDNAFSNQATAWFSDLTEGKWKGETAEEKAARERRMAALTPKAGKAAVTTPTPAGAPHSPQRTAGAATPAP